MFAFFARTLLVLLALYTLFMGGFLVKKERSGWVILGVLAGLWVLPTLMIGSAVVYYTYLRARVQKNSD
ncbi:MAG: hypothetical protein Q4C70_02325, partial [Planctomycetia bacterium]|nr:hypothetical protein [Planctomycetia bacterium]